MKLKTIYESTSFNPKSVKIGDQTWMTENLNVDDGGEGIYHYYGQTYYTWDAAMRVTKDLQGWHLPSNEEWKKLFESVGGKDVAGKMLKSTRGWKSYWKYNGNGEDSFGFSALPNGAMSNDGYCTHQRYYSYFWSSTEDSSRSAYCMDLYYDSDDAHLDQAGKDMGSSVRCLKD